MCFDGWGRLEKKMNSEIEVGLEIEKGWWGENK